MSEYPLYHTLFHKSHAKLGARMVAFAGYDMPVQYPTGVMVEHNWTRQHAGLFDVSHMGQCVISCPDPDLLEQSLEMLLPLDVKGMAPLQMRYTQLLNESGGIIDDLIMSRSTIPGRFYMVLNASRKEIDFAYISTHMPKSVVVTRQDKILLALQGPEAENVLADLNPAVRDIPFMQFQLLDILGGEAHVSRCGYTGEDGFEISCCGSRGEALWDLLVADPRVKPIGLGARDSLRLESGLCLYGHDIDETTSPNEAGLMWSIPKRRREEGGFIGATRVQNEIINGTKRKRVGIKPDGRAPAREGTVVQNVAGREIGTITSGSFGPTVAGPVAMGYVETEYASEGTPLFLLVRDKALPASVVKLPFVPNRFKR